MEAVVGVTGSQAGHSATAASRTRDRLFYSGLSAALIATIVTGFARTYYFRGFSDAQAMPLLLYVHGALFSAWIALFAVQTSLVAAGRRNIHRRLGLLGAVLAAADVVFAYLTAIEAARRGYNPSHYTRDALAFMAVPLGDVVVFALLTAAGLWCRRDTETHKRLMLLGTIGGTLIPAISRLQAYGHEKMPLLLLGMFYLAGPIYDRTSRGRIHPVYLSVGFPVFLAVPLRFLIGATDGWHTAARWLIR
jgi:hypothetical protein